MSDSAINTHNEPEQSTVDQGKDEPILKSNISAIRLWAFLALLAHALLAITWLSTSWVPWIIPDVHTQVLVSSIGIIIHGAVLCTVGKLKMPPFARIFSIRFGLIYLLLSVLLYLVTATVTQGMTHKDPLRYQQHLDSMERNRLEGNGRQEDPV